MKIKEGDIIEDVNGVKCEVLCVIRDLDTGELLGANVYYVGSGGKAKFLKYENKSMFKVRN